MKTLSGILCGILALAPLAAAGSVTPAALRDTSLGTPPALGSAWLARTTDNICGLSNLNQLSNPAEVDFAACLAATPQMKKMRDEKIDPSSPDGIRLHTEAVNRVKDACETVRVANGYCSVWKEIRHKDGRAIADVTDKVKAQL